MNLGKIFVNDLVNLWTKFDYIYSLELKWVLKWFKKITKLEPFTLENLEKIKDLFDKLWLVYSYFEKEEYFDDEKMLFIKWDNWKDKYIDIYVSNNQKVINLLDKILKEKDNNYKKNYLIWRLLGYPDCCIKSFLEIDYNSDLGFNARVKNNTKWKFDWRLNNLINPYSLLPFFPCTYNCKEAIKYAENNLDIIWNREEIKSIFNNVIEYKDFWNYKILDKNSSNKNIFNFKN